MFIRDPWTTTTGPVAGPVVAGLGALATSDQALLRQLHATALAIYQAQRDVLAADARGDMPYVSARLVDLQRMRDLFVDTAARFRANDPEALTAMDQVILSVGTWIQEAVDAAPGAIAALPNIFLDAVGKIGVKAGTTAIAISLPLIGLGLLVLWLVGRAERTRTYRKVVA